MTPYSKIDPPIEEYLQKQFHERYNWYDRVALVNKYRLYFLQISIIVLAGIIPLVNVQHTYISDENVRIVSIFLGEAIIILTAVSQFSKLHQNWIRYRKTAELLRNEYINFTHYLNIYNKLEQDGRIKLFISRSENIIQNEGKDFFLSSSK